MPSFTMLSSRGVIAISGDDRVAFLQGLTSNDVALVSPNRVVFSTFLTAQGKYLHDFFIAASGDLLLLDCEDMTHDFAVAAITGDGAAALVGLADETPGLATTFDDGIAFVDPRHTGLGVRVLLTQDRAAATLQATGAEETGPEDYDRQRIALGVPDGSRDLIIEKSTLLDSNYDTLNAISWDKGCYLGQELTARMKYRGLAKKRLMAVAVDGPLPPIGTPITLDGREVGEMRSGNGDLAIGLLRLDAAEQAASGARLTAGDATITPRNPQSG